MRMGNPPWAPLPDSLTSPESRCEMHSEKGVELRLGPEDMAAARGDIAGASDLE